MDGPRDDRLALARDAAFKDGKRRPRTASAALQRNAELQSASSAAPANVQSLEGQERAKTDCQSTRQLPLHGHKCHPDRTPDSSAVNEHASQERLIPPGVSTMRAPTKEEMFNCSRRHMSLDEAVASDKREAALHGTRPLYAFGHVTFTCFSLLLVPTHFADTLLATIWVLANSSCSRGDTPVLLSNGCNAWDG